MGLVAHYAGARERMLAIADSLSDADAALRVATCPKWTVKDVFAHVAGACTDVLEGRIEGAATDPWTAVQVADRAERALAEVATEWRAAAPAFDEVLQSLEPMGGGINRIGIDAWTHEQDVRGTVGQPGGRDEPVVPWALGLVLGSYARHWDESGRAPVRIIGSSDEWALGDGEPVATMEASDFELLRVLIGRRSREQALAMWVEGDGELFVDQLIAFTFSPTDIVE